MTKKYISLGILVACLASVYLFTYLTPQNAYSDTIDPLKALTRDQQHSTKPTLLVVHKTGCKDCAAVAKTFAGIENKLNNKVNLVVVDAMNDNSKEIIQKYQITNAPTFVWLKNGKEISRYWGTNKRMLREFLSLQKGKGVNNGPVTKK
ncbi:thioredoxin [Weissella oryzae SG25]|uniref:Thioredoxin n=1 Tax=Weissella oryzae (strain DSM 25784 / JCM 18191 / LMG 30913 / SG25) TaxID=1329250 RepID=A0A069CVN1_WEIOS|nr:thioredoxin family protein [Weissella oryzae]GAK31544.1 thioredoxin [Weissella oryzae SG25]